MPPKIWSSCLDSFKDFFAYLQNARPVPFWNCLYQVDFHAPLVQRADESAFTNDNETVFLTTLFGKAMGPVVCSLSLEFFVVLTNWAAEICRQPPDLSY
jgi:hypothetical protein